MKKLIYLDIIVGSLLISITFYNELSLDLVPISANAFLLLSGLTFANFICIFVMWHKYKFLIFIPFLISLFIITIWFISQSIGYQLGTPTKPRCPEKYFTEERRQDLTIIAKELLSTQDEQSKQTAEKKLKKYHFWVHNIERDANVVELAYYRRRTIPIYIFSPDGPPESYRSNKYAIKLSDDWYFYEY